MDDKDDIDDEDDDKPSFSSNMSGPPSLARRVGNMTGSTSVAYLSPMDRMDSKELLFSLLFTTSTDQPSSRFSSSVGRHATPYDDPDEYFSTPTSLPPPPTVKATSEGHSQPKEEETVRDLEIKIEELQARLVEKKMLEKKEQLPSSVNNSVQGRSSDSSDNNDYDTIVKVERSNSNEGQEEWKKPSEKAGDSRDVVIENNVHAPFISANAKEVPISKLLKKDSFNKIKFNQEDFLNSILSSPQTSVKRVSEGEGTGACKIPPHAKKHGIGISNKDMQPIPKQIADGVIKDFKSAGRFEEGIGRNVDSGWETIEEGVFENKFLETDIPQEVVEIALPPDPNIPHTRSRRTEGYDYTEQNSFDFDRMNPIDSKSNSVDNFQNENIPGKTLSTNENCPDSRNQSMYSKESVEYSDLPPLKYPDHSPINPPSTAGDGQNPLLSNLSNEKSGHSTQLPPKKKSQEMTSLSGENFTFTSELNKDDISGYQEFTNSTKISYSNKVTGNSSLHTVPRYASYMSSLQSLSDHHGFVIKDVTPDGNCMFSAIVDQLRIQGNFDLTPNSLRKTAVEYLRANPKNQDGTHLESFLSTETWLEYLNRMGQESQWGDHMVLQACTEVTGQRIVVFKPNTNKTVLVPTAEESLENTSLTLGHIGESHFVSLRPKDWETNWPLMAHAHRAKMKEKQKLARKKIREIKKSKKQKKTPEPTVSNKEDSTSADEKGKETGSEKGETGSEKAKEAGSEKGKETGSEKGETGSGTGETESGTGETESGTGETGSGTGETESGTEVTETEGATQEVVKEKEPDKDEDDDSDEEEVESDDSQFKTTDDFEELVSNRSAIDILSLIPMAHLSHIMKIMIEPRFLLTFPGDSAVFQYDLKRDRDDPNFRKMHFGSIVEELATTMSNLGPNRDQAILPPIPKMIGYDIKQNLAYSGKIDGLDNKQILYTADGQHTLPGYVRIKISIAGDQAFTKQLLSQTKYSEYHLHNASLDRNRKLFIGIRCPVWPEEAKEWLTRGRPAKWPNEEMLELAKEDECFLIGRPHPQSCFPDAEWQWVFPTTEIRIAREALSDEQKYCFRVFKVLVDFHTRNLPVRLTTTHLKTVMYTTCEVLSADHWKLNPGGCLLFLLHRLVVHLRIGVLPNYFIPANNMIDYFSQGQLCALRQRLYAVRVFPVAALFIIIDHHDVFGAVFLDKTLEDIVRFRKHQNLDQSTEECFLRNHSKYFRALVLSVQFKNAKRSLEEAFLAKTGKLLNENVLCENESFEKFSLDFTGDEFGELKGLVAYEMDMICESDFTRLLHSSSEYVHLKDILDVNDCLEYSDVPVQRNSVDSRYKELVFLESLSFHFTDQRLYQKAAHFLRCAIHKTLQAIQCSNKETEQQATERSSKEERVQHAEDSLYSYALLRFYHDLYCAYKSMGQTELMQEYIEDYEAVCMTCGYSYHYTRVANIWQKLGNSVRAQTLRDQADSTNSSQTCCANVSRYDSFDDLD
ncbi:uncharacterized protein LOC110455144 isoform X2 [Mizuhopecten yessoensis]|uniref:uncharacterized protein LOC110455144 isoform X2 n=1 Tax=Mizuhopecten yessoensis TaxID=6573 RepID=UPI000B45DC2D|nr:uncharacterized protein LOC110455144 isoform X2 [Mizuhopecten yessoensis]